MYAITYQGRKYSAGYFYKFGDDAQKEPTLFNNENEAEDARKHIANSYGMSVDLFLIKKVA